MYYHEVDFLTPYFELGTGPENARHLPLLEEVDERLDAFDDPGHCLAHASVLSEVADIYRNPQSLDTEQARSALAKSNYMLFIASKDECKQPAAERDLVFNSLRRSLIERSIETQLPAVLRQIASTAYNLPIESTFNRETDVITGLRSELLALAIPIAVTTECPDITKGRKFIGWPSYLRQDQVPGVKVRGNFKHLPLNRGFDMRLSQYTDEWEELAKQRTPVQVKTGRPSVSEYVPSIKLVSMNDIGRTKTPQEAKAIAADISMPIDTLYFSRRERLSRIYRRFFKASGVLE